MICRKSGGGGTLNFVGVVEEDDANSGGSGKGIYDGVNYVAGLKATGASTLIDARLATLNMYRPLTTTGGRTIASGTSFYRSTLKVSQVAKGIGFGLTGIGIGYDYLIGIPRYQEGIGDEWSVNPDKAAVNTVVSL